MLTPEQVINIRSGHVTRNQVMQRALPAGLHRYWDDAGCAIDLLFSSHEELRARLAVYEEDVDVSHKHECCACRFVMNDPDTQLQECYTHASLRRRLAVLESIRDAAIPAAAWSGCCKCGAGCHTHQCQDLRALRAALDGEVD